MDLPPERAALAVERHDCPNCDAPAGSACRTRGGKTAAKYHTPRFVLVPALREELEVLVPANRHSGCAWKQGPALAVVPAPRTERPVRIGYARTSTARQELASQLELLTGPLTGIYDPNGMGAMFFAVLAVAGQIERNYIREKTLEGQVAAAAKGNHGGRPKVIDDDMLTFAVALKDKGVPVPEIAKKLTIKTGKNAGKNPSVASLYRALAEAEEAAADDGLPRRPKPVRIRRPGDPLTAEEIDLRERLQSQPHPNSEIRS
ncbi:zinc finger domain-containing protein [Streptomyces sp. 3211]|uniref:zinc finger domain-containing protein n=1 Tax=Streptomyces sp. 3211 TaxID=1964449 RepID=UPI0009A533DE|nr:hypothetical protein [Streptomyces sp. 3211]